MILHTYDRCDAVTMPIGERLHRATQVWSAVVAASGCSRNQLRGVAKHRRLARARQLLAYLLRTMCHLSLIEVGMQLGGRDHTTVIAAIRRIERCISDGDPYVVALLQEVLPRLNPGETTAAPDSAMLR